MGVLSKYGKKEPKKVKQYPLKVDYDLFEVFEKYCNDIGRSVNEVLKLMIEGELEEEGYMKYYHENQREETIKILRDSPDSSLNIEDKGKSRRAKPKKKPVKKAEKDVIELDEDNNESI